MRESIYLFYHLLVVVFLKREFRCAISFLSLVFISLPFFLHAYITHKKIAMKYAHTWIITCMNKHKWRASYFWYFHSGFFWMCFSLSRFYIDPSSPPASTHDHSKVGMLRVMPRSQACRHLVPPEQSGEVYVYPFGGRRGREAELEGTIMWISDSSTM